MRVALVQDYLRMGGTERQTVALANAFAAAGHNVLLLTFRPGGALAANISERVHHRSLQSRDFHADWFAPALGRTLTEFKPEIIQLMGRMANARGWRLARTQHGASLVATVRTGKRLPRFYQLTLRRADAVIANSEHSVQRLAREYSIAGSRVHLVRNGVVTSNASASVSREAVRAGLGTPTATFVMVCAAMMHPGKGHEALIKIAAKLPADPPWELWLAGDGPERTTLEKLTKETALPVDRVRFLGLRPDVEPLYVAADIAVLASQPTRESLPNFLVEAQWHGLPVVAYDAAGLAETFAPTVSGLSIPFGDEEAFAAAISELKADSARRSIMGEAARAYARQEFDPAQQTQRYLDLYARLRSESDAA